MYKKATKLCCNSNAQNCSKKQKAKINKYSSSRYCKKLTNVLNVKGVLWGRISLWDFLPRKFVWVRNIELQTKNKRMNICLVFVFITVSIINKVNSLFLRLSFGLITTAIIHFTSAKNKPHWKNGLFLHKIEVLSNFKR